MKYLITGGAGFIGFHLCSELLKENEVIIYDNLSNYYNLNLKEKNVRDLIKLGAKFVKGDILNYKTLFESIEGNDVVIHLAAQPGIKYSMEHPVITNRINVEGTLNVLESLKKNPHVKLIFFSSSSVFGEVSRPPTTENHPKNPISIYGLSKSVCEEYMHQYIKNYALNVVTLRPFTVCGARQRPDMAIFKFIDSIYNGREVTIFGDGRQTRDWGNVKNIVNAAKEASQNKKVSNEIFNIGNGTATSVLEVVNLVAAALKKEPNLKFIERRNFDPLHTLADISRAKKLLNYRPQYDLKDAIDSQISFYLNNLDLFKKS
ncbi:MAG: NAD-dependent epimerase/dehydratase family protein [Candidatus Helarchaeota archaeon]